LQFKVTLFGNSTLILINSPAAEMEFVLDRAREFLGAECHPQLRLVSRRCRDALEAAPRQLLRVKDYLSSAALFVLARDEFGMPERKKDIAAIAARGGHLEVLKWLRAKKGRCSWTSRVCESAAGQGCLQIIQWLRTQRPPCPWNKETCGAAARGSHVEVLQ
jgi:hypothetical protein